MTRIRTIKPELFSHEALYEAEQESKLPLRLAFIGLLTCCDREGRFRWRPRQLKLNVLPYDESLDFEEILNCLVLNGFIIKYKVNNQYYACFPTWHRHQRINNKESQSELPSVDEGQVISVNYPLSTDESREAHASSTRESSVSHASVTENQLGNSCLDLPSGEGEQEGKGKEGEEEGKGNSPAQQGESEACSSSQPVAIAIPLNSGEYPVTQSQIQQWESLYPGIDILQSLRNIRGWNLANPKRRKTKSGILSHINTWLSKEQNQAGKQSHPFNNRAPPYKPPSDLSEYNARVAEQWIRESETKIIVGEIVK